MRITKNKSGLFLMEMIIVLLFFAIGAAIAVRIFVSAWLLSKESAVLTGAVTETENAAELLLADRGDSTLLTAYYQMNGKNDELEIFFDKDFQATAEENAVYVLKIEEEQKETMREFHLCFKDAADGEELFSLPLTIYREAL